MKELEWFRVRREAERREPSYRRRLARALYEARQLDEAEALFRDLARERPGTPAAVAFHHGHLQAHLDEGYLGALAAQRGDRAAADRICLRLERLDGPFLFGSHTYWRAAVAALRGEAERAASLLRQAFAEGLPMEMFIHTDVHFECLRTYPVYQALLHPRP